MSLVQYQVERRPIGPDGHVYRGLQPGDFVSIPSDWTALSGLTGTSTTNRFLNGLALGLGNGPMYVPLGVAVPALNISVTSHIVEQAGEPWLVQSTHYSIDAALAGAATVAAAIGTDNVRIVRTLYGATTFSLN